jgi:single-stranded-DNA-specific exonuclease
VGSGRSIPAFDLHGALRECAEHLERWGGHRAAAGLSILPESLPAFREAFTAHADGALTVGDLVPRLAVDAVVDGRELTLDLCEELERLAPFGLGNPAVTLLAVGCELSELGAVGEGKHLRLAVTANGVRSGAIAFGQGSRLDSYRRPVIWDVAFRLGANRWNGTVAPQLVVRRLLETPERYRELRAWLMGEWRKEPAERNATAAAVFGELGLEDGTDTPRWRPLVESETFMGLLAEAPLAAAA